MEACRDRADRDAFSEIVRANAGVVVALDRDGNLDIHRGLVRTEDAAAYRAARAGNSGQRRHRRHRRAERHGRLRRSPRPAGRHPATPRPASATAATPTRCATIFGSCAPRPCAGRWRGTPAVATDLIGFVLARSVGFGRPPPGLRAAGAGAAPRVPGHVRLRRHEGERDHEAPRPGARGGPRLAGRGRRRRGVPRLPGAARRGPRQRARACGRLAHGAAPGRRQRRLQGARGGGAQPRHRLPRGTRGDRRPAVRTRTSSGTG